MPLLGPKIGFGPRWLQPWLSKLKKCDELNVDNCPEGAVDGCCAVVPCTYCLELQISSGQTFFGTAEWDGEQWIGAVDGILFSAIWQKVYGICQFTVEFGGEVVAELECYEISCRDSSGEAVVSVDGYEATLIWTKKEGKPLPYVWEGGTEQYPEGCRTWFCGTCECTCKSLCATITTPAPSCLNCTGTLVLGSYDSRCVGPEWTGTLSCGGETHYLSVALKRDDYDGSCILEVSVSGEDLDPIQIVDCNAINASWRLYDGTILTVACMECSCDQVDSCEVGCCWPLLFPPAYPCGYFKDLSASVEAPGCDIDGLIAVISNTGAVTFKGSCGACGATSPADLGTTLGQKPSGLADPSTGYCLMTPCGVSICLLLECDSTVANVPGLAECCGKFRLWVGTSVKLAGDVGDRPSNPGVNNCNFWKRISADSCECLPDSAGVMLQFTVDLTGDCDTVSSAGVCAGIPDCCDPVCSSFTLVI